VLAWELQAKEQGGLPAPVRKRLDALASGSAKAATPKVKTGGRFLREWGGVTHVVDVVEGGYLWKGERHRSLSAIARAITGALWSGPRFFGLQEEREQAGAKAGGAGDAKSPPCPAEGRPRSAQGQYSGARKGSMSARTSGASSSSRPQVRCAIYTRKSSEEGLGQEFNSLDAQREACAAYVASQKHEGLEARP
jgi:hypothetical protein